MDKQEIANRINIFIMQESNIDDESIINEDMNFFEEGLLDSIMAVSLISYCVEEFDCDITVDDFAEDSMHTVNGLADYICKVTNQS